MVKQLLQEWNKISKTSWSTASEITDTYSSEKNIFQRSQHHRLPYKMIKCLKQSLGILSPQYRLHIKCTVIMVMSSRQASIRISKWYTCKGEKTGLDWYDLIQLHHHVTSLQARNFPPTASPRWTLAAIFSCFKSPDFPQANSHLEKHMNQAGTTHKKQKKRKKKKVCRAIGLVLF